MALAVPLSRFTSRVGGGSAFYGTTHIVKLTIKYAESCPIGARPDRRVLGVLDLVAHGSGSLVSFEIAEAQVQIDDDSAIVSSVSYVPANHVLSLTVSYRHHGEQVQIFAGIAEWSHVPAYFACLLPTGKFVEFYFKL
jgi:hypothetical protein